MPCICRAVLPCKTNRHKPSGEMTNPWWLAASVLTHMIPGFFSTRVPRVRLCLANCTVSRATCLHPQGPLPTENMSCSYPQEIDHVSYNTRSLPGMHNLARTMLYVALGMPTHKTISSCLGGWALMVCYPSSFPQLHSISWTTFINMS